MRLLVTGGAGFIGSNFIRHMLESSRSIKIFNLDALTYAGNLENLSDIRTDPRHVFINGDIADPAAVGRCFKQGIDVVVNFAAETHVDRSILDVTTFLRTNVFGTQNLLDFARRYKVFRYVQISTDEVYGSLGEVGAFTEKSPLKPNSPYSASKAGADLLVRSYQNTYSLNTVITRCSNNYGPFQFPEKFVPLMVLNAMENRKLPVYGDGLYVRDWIHVKDHCRALERVITASHPSDLYNIGGNEERKNLEVVIQILAILGKSTEIVEHVEDRPGHDRRYAIDARRISEELGWSPQVPFLQGLAQTVQWYRENSQWVRQVRSGAYRRYYETMYDRRARTLSNLS